MRQEDLTYFESREFRAALQQYESALSEGRQVYMDADEMTDIAEYYMVNQREHEAIECITRARELHPDAVDPQIFLARQHLFHNRLKQAKRIANQIEDQDDREVLFLRQEILIKENRIDEAKRFMLDHLEALEDERDNFIYDTAGVFADYNLWQECYEWIQRLLAENPEYEHTDTMLCEALINLGRADEALPLLEKKIDKDAFDTHVWYLLAQAYLCSDCTDEALEALDYLLAIDENHADAQLMRANSLMLLDRYKEAHEQFLHYLNNHPNDIAAIYSDTMSLLSLSHFEEAVASGERALRLAHNQGAELYPFRVVYSNALSRNGQTEKALEQLDLAEQEESCTITTTLDGDIINDSVWENHYDYPRLRAFVLLDAGRDQEALPILAKLITEEPIDYQRNFSIAVYLLDHEYVELANDIFKMLVQHDSDEFLSDCAPYLAYCAYIMRDKVTLLEYLELAVKGNPRITGLLFSNIFDGIPVEDYVSEALKLPDNTED